MSGIEGNEPERIETREGDSKAKETGEMLLSSVQGDATVEKGAAKFAASFKDGSAIERLQNLEDEINHPEAKERYMALSEAELRDRLKTGERGAEVLASHIQSVNERLTTTRQKMDTSDLLKYS